MQNKILENCDAKIMLNLWTYVYVVAVIDELWL